MKSQVVYKAFDGKIFEKEDDCIKYELCLTVVFIVNDKCFIAKDWEEFISLCRHCLYGGVIITQHIDKQGMRLLYRDAYFGSGNFPSQVGLYKYNSDYDELTKVE